MLLIIISPFLASVFLHVAPITTFRSRVFWQPTCSTGPRVEESSNSHILPKFLILLPLLTCLFVLFCLPWPWRVHECTCRSRYTRATLYIIKYLAGDCSWMCSYCCANCGETIREKLPMIHSRSWCLHDSPLLLLIFCVNNSYSNEWRYPRNIHNNSVRIRTEFRTKKATTTTAEDGEWWPLIIRAGILGSHRWKMEEPHQDAIANGEGGKKLPRRQRGNNRKEEQEK